VDPAAGVGNGCGYGGVFNQGLATVATSAQAVPQAWVLNGLLGTFTADLYDNPEKGLRCQISTAPSKFSTGMFSWFPLFFPLKEAVHVPAGASLRVHMWRRVDTDVGKVWYEWSVTVHRDGEVLSVTPIHNPAGRSCHVSM
jgi:type II protein arginine methyltransferase